MLPCPANDYPQTSSGPSGDTCTCYHSEAFHQPPPAPNVSNHSDQLHPAQPPTGPPTFLSFPSHISPTLGPHSVLPGVPTNRSAPLLRTFQPFQGQLTSEDNRQRSIARMNPPRQKRKPPAGKHRSETLVPDPIPPNSLAVLLLPTNVRSFNCSMPDLTPSLAPHVSCHGAFTPRSSTSSATPGSPWTAVNSDHSPSACWI